MENYQQYSGGCESKKDWLDRLPLSMAYVPIQKWENLYSPEKGLRHGTIFHDLDFPFRGKGGCCR